MYGGYVLHTCAILEEGSGVSIEGLGPGASAVATVDYKRRRRIAPNHTMTHVLNYALRKVGLVWLFDALVCIAETAISHTRCLAVSPLVADRFWEGISIKRARRCRTRSSGEIDG